MNHNHTVDIFNIPLTLQQEVLGSWLTIKDVAKLDSAVCSRENRSLFLELLSHENMVLINPDIPNDRIVLLVSWMVAREVCVTSCRLSKAVAPSLYKSFFNGTGKRLVVLMIENWNKTSRMLRCAAAVCTNLKEISLKDCSSMRGLETLLQASQKTICKLTLYDCDLSGFRLGDCELPALQLLSVHFCRELNNSTLNQLMRSAPNLEILTCCIKSNGFDGVVFSQYLRVISIFGSDQTDAMFCSLVHSCPLLEVVDISFCRLLTDVSIIDLVQHAKHITSLYVSHNGNFTDASLEAIAEHCGERLRHLCLYGCEQLTDDGLQHMNKCCHHLEGLGIGFIFNEHFTIPSVPALLQNNPLLQEVSISWEEDADGLMATIARSCPQLRYLDIRGLHGYTEAGIIMAIRSASTTLRTVAVRHQCTIFRQLIHSSWNKQYRPDVEFLYPSDGLLPFWKQYRS